VDNGDGSVTDTKTGLMWEKLSDDGSIHDYDNVYTWNEAFSVHVAGVNQEQFAGHGDWRVPTANELQTLADYARSEPAIDSVFDSACGSGCTVLTCACTQAHDAQRDAHYWTASPLVSTPYRAWKVSFRDGSLFADDELVPLYVRAVRDVP
jgi:hypothetical protein